MEVLTPIDGYDAQFLTLAVTIVDEQTEDKEDDDDDDYNDDFLWLFLSLMMA